MYSIPEYPDLTGIIRSALIQICLGEHDIQFHFDSGSWIGSQATVEQTLDGVQICSWGEAGLIGPVFQSLLGQAPTGFSVPNPKRLELYFEGGQTLAFLDDSEQFESFQVYQHGNSMPTLIV